MADIAKETGVSRGPLYSDCDTAELPGLGASGLVHGAGDSEVFEKRLLDFGRVFFAGLGGAAQRPDA